MFPVVGALSRAEYWQVDVLRPIKCEIWGRFNNVYLSYNILLNGERIEICCAFVRTPFNENSRSSQKSPLKVVRFFDHILDGSVQSTRSSTSRYRKFNVLLPLGGGGL